MSLDINTIKELETNLLELKKVNNEIQNFMKMRGGGHKSDNSSIEYFIEKKKKYNKFIISFLISIIITILILILKKYNNRIIDNKLLGGATTNFMVDNFTLIIRYKIYEFWNNLPKGKILLLSIIFIFLYTYLRSKKQSFMCFGCSKGDWWYKCYKGTGYNSIGCKVYQKVYDVLDWVISLGFDTIKTIKKVIDATIKGFTIAKRKIMKLVYIIKALSELDLSLPPIPVPKVNMSCSSFGGKVNVCLVIADIINAPLEGLAITLRQSLNKMLYIFKMFWNILKKTIGYIIKSIAKAMGYMILPLHILLGLLVDLKRTFEFILYTIRKLGIFNMILFNFANFIKSIFPIRNFGTLIAISVLVFVLFILFPLIGGIAAGFRAFSKIFNSSYDNVISTPFEFIGEAMDNYQPTPNNLE